MTDSKNESTPSAQTVTYRDAGVDIDAGNALVEAIKPVVKATSRAGSLGAIGGFGGLFDLKAAGYSDPILVAANDGVGTKLKIAIETGLHETIGIDLVAMCVNDLIVQGAEPLFFLDYLATAKLDVENAKTVIAGIAEGCRQAGCALIGGETAEMPGMYQNDDYDLAGFSVGAAERGTLLPRDDVMPGDLLIGLMSNGIHSNGFSLIRKLIAKENLAWNDGAPWDPTNMVAESLLEPTRIYVKPILSILKSVQHPNQKIKALAHITGGGLTENLPRVLPKNTIAQIDLDSWTPHRVFAWAAKTGNIGAAEMLRTLNCGIGMVIVAAKSDADNIVAELNANDESAIIIGELHTSRTTDEAPTVEYTGTLGIAE